MNQERMSDFGDCAIRSKKIIVGGFDLSGLNRQMEQLNSLDIQLVKIKEEIGKLAKQMSELAKNPVTVTGYLYETAEGTRDGSSQQCDS